MTAPASPEPQAAPPARLEYVGQAAPATEAGTTPQSLWVHPGMEVFAQYALTSTYGSQAGSTWFHDLELPRAHFSLDGGEGPVRARVLFEVVQSAAYGSLIGVGGNSILYRIREAYAAWTPFHGFEIEAGVVPTFTIAELDGTWMLDAITASMLETTGLASPADMGATVRYNFPSKYGWIAMGAFNGEGYTSPELNRGESGELALELHPLPHGALRPLALFGSYVAGATGVDPARSNRATGGLLWQGRMFRGGLSYTYAWGVADNAALESTITEAFVRVEPVDRLLLGARATYWLRNTSATSTDAITTVWGSVGWRIAEPLEVHLAVTRALPTSLTQNELAGSNYLELRTIASVVF